MKNLNEKIKNFELNFKIYNIYYYNLRKHFFICYIGTSDSRCIWR